MLIKRLSTVAVAVSLVACASAQRAEPVPPTPAPATRVAEPAPQPHPYAMPQAQPRAVVRAPSWFVNLPEDTPEMTFAAGTASSTDEQMAYDKARMSAERKLVEQINSRITTQTNSYRADRGNTTVESFQQVTRKNARGELSGAQRVDSQVTFDGQFYKVYVLLRLPTGDANVMQTRRDQQRLARETEIRSRAKEMDMDRNEAAERKEQRENDENLQRSLTPQSRVAPVTVPVASGEVQLLDVDNAEYKRRRDETLSKPGAVVGQITVR